MTWGKHFAEDNGLALPAGAAVLGPLPKAIPKTLGVRVLTQEGSSPFTSGVKALAIATRNPTLSRAGAIVKENQPELWVIYEAGVAWYATYQTLHDPDSWYRVEDDDGP